MTPVEKLQVAILKLESLRGHSPFGNDLEVVDADSALYLINRGTDLSDYMFQTLSTEDPDEAQLIVTLHRTIDAQLAILRDALKVWDNVRDEGSPDHLVRHVEGYMSGTVLALADAILGDLA